MIENDLDYYRRVAKRSKWISALALVFSIVALVINIVRLMTQPG